MGRHCAFQTSVVSLLLILILMGCSRYETRVVPFKMPAAYPNVMEVAGAQIAAKAYDNPQEADNAFGFNIRDAGILPVQVVFDNKGTHSLEIIPSRTYLIDTGNNLWPIIDASLAYDRIAKKTELGEVAPEAGKGGFLAGAAGALIGAAIGIVTGHNVGDAAMKGAALGAAAGATSGGLSGLASNQDVQRKIREDLRNRSLETHPIIPNEIAHGFIFFPGEAKTPMELRLTLKETDTGKDHILVIKFAVPQAEKK